jgi:hypothetical protein
MLNKKDWCKLWRKRQKRLNFYKALTAFQERNQLKLLLKASERKQKLYKNRMRKMYNLRLKSLFKKLKFLKRQIIKFQLKYGIYG